MTVKANMPALCKQPKKLPWTAIPATSAVSTGHGRRARRTIKAVLVPAWIEFAGAAQVAQVRRTVTKKGKKTVEGTAGRGQRRRCSQPTRARQVQDRCPGSGNDLPFCVQHKTNTTRGSGKDQHADNTDKTVLPGTRRHAC